MALASDTEAITEPTARTAATVVMIARFISKSPSKIALFELQLAQHASGTMPPLIKTHDKRLCSVLLTGLHPRNDGNGRGFDQGRHPVDFG
jgi:hypothetical protein